MTNVNITHCKHDVDLTFRSCALCYNEQQKKPLKVGRYEIVLALDFGTARIEAPSLLTARDRDKLQSVFELLTMDPVADAPEKPETP